MSDGKDANRVGRLEIDDMVRKPLDRCVSRSQVCRDVLDEGAGSRELANSFGSDFDFEEEPPAEPGPLFVVPLGRLF